jgi:hypothetical protein
MGSCMNNSEVYRANATDCCKLAEVINDLPDKLVLLNMAEAWLRLADYVERREQNEVGEHFGADRSCDPDDVNPE